MVHGVIHILAPEVIGLQGPAINKRFTCPSKTMLVHVPTMMNMPALSNWWNSTSLFLPQCSTCLAPTSSTTVFSSCAGLPWTVSPKRLAAKGQAVSWMSQSCAWLKTKQGATGFEHWFVCWDVNMSTFPFRWGHPLEPIVSLCRAWQTENPTWQSNPLAYASWRWDPGFRYLMAVCLGHGHMSCKTLRGNYATTTAAVVPNSSMFSTLAFPQSPTSVTRFWSQCQVCQATGWAACRWGLASATWGWRAHHVCHVPVTWPDSSDHKFSNSMVRASGCGFLRSGGSCWDRNKSQSWLSQAYRSWSLSTGGNPIYIQQKSGHLATARSQRAVLAAAWSCICHLCPGAADSSSCRAAPNLESCFFLESWTNQYVQHKEDKEEKKKTHSYCAFVSGGRTRDHEFVETLWYNARCPWSASQAVPGRGPSMQGPECSPRLPWCQAF